jgi:CRP-like cAMP-binding protein
MNNFDILFEYIENKSSLALSATDRLMITDKFRQKKLLKRQYFLQEGDVCKHMGFVIKGATKMFTVDQRGHQHILKFGLENWWVGDYESFMLLTPSIYNVEALEDLEILLITNELLQNLVQNIPAVSAMMDSLNRQGTIATQKRMQASISLTAEERYEDLIKTYPMFAQRFTLNMIASYLGISPETLSRIRKNLVK